MFGYVKAYKPEMKIAEYDTYKAVYCSLCKVLGKKYGIMAKMTLSYDFTFMALLRLCIQNECVGYSVMRCSFNPTKKCNCLKNGGEELEYTAAASIILFYYKVKDNITDSGFFGKIKSYLLLPFAARYRKKALKIYPELDIHAAEYITAQSAVESRNTDSFDIASEPSARFLSSAFARDKDTEQTKRVLEQIGYFSAKWIYLCDALDDLKRDIKSGNYNVIKNHFSLDENSSEDDINNAKDYTEGVINSYNSGICNAFSLLEKKRYDTILGNILYLGLPNTLKQIKTGEKSDKNPAERTEN